MNLLSWIIFGFLVGVVTNLLNPQPSYNGILTSVMLGISGAFIGGTVAVIALNTSFLGLSLFSLMIAILSAFLILFFGRGIRS